MLPLASFLAPWAVSVIERCLSSWQLAQMGLSRPGTSRAGCCANCGQEIAHRQEHSRVANVSNRIEHLPRVVHSNQRHPQARSRSGVRDKRSQPKQIVFQRAGVGFRSTQPSVAARDPPRRGSVLNAIRGAAKRLMTKVKY